MTSDMTGVIAAKSDQVNAADLVTKPITVTVAKVAIKGGTEQPVSMTLEGMDKVFRPSKTVCRVLVAVWGADANEYVGRSMTLFCDPTVKWAGLAVGGIRVSHVSHLESERVVVVKESREKNKAFTIKPLQSAAPKPQLTPEQFTEARIAAIQAETDGDKLDKLFANAKVKLAAHPDLMERVDVAFRARVNALTEVE